MANVLDTIRTKKAAFTSSALSGKGARSVLGAATLAGALAFGAACGGKQPEPKVPGPTTTTTTTTPGDKTTITSFTKATDSSKVDKVGGSDGALKADGYMDLAFVVEVEGPVTALFILSSDANGTPNGEYDADTLVGGQEFPKDIGVALKGQNTAGLGVFEGDKLVSSPDGSLSLPAGKHKLTVYFSNTGVLTPGSSVVVFGRGVGNTVVKGPVSTL